MPDSTHAVGLLLVLFAGAMVRANLTYWLGRGLVTWGRHTRLARHLDGPAMRRAEALVARWGVLAVPLCFLTVGVQTAVNATAGATRMPLRRYLPAVVVGAAIWAALYATVGLGAVVAAFAVAAHSPPALLAVLLPLVVAAILWRRRARARRLAPAAPADRSRAQVERDRDEPRAVAPDRRRD